MQQHSAFSGLSDALNQFGQQLSGALQIPLVRLFGQSPAGLNSTGESDLRMYYDGIKQQQMKTMHGGITMAYQLTAKSKGIKLPDNFALDFASLWQLDDKEKADVASSVGQTVDKAVEGGLISQKTALKELRQSSRRTGIFTNITEEQINAADDEITPPGGEGLPEGMEGLGGPPVPNLGEKNEVRPEGKAGAIPDGARRRVQLQQPPTPSRKTD